MANLQQVEEQLEKYRQTAEYKKSIILGRLIDFCCELEKIKNPNIQATLKTDLQWLKQLIKSYECHTEYLQPVDLELVNETYRYYKHLIRKL